MQCTETSQNQWAADISGVDRPCWFELLRLRWQLRESIGDWGPSRSGGLDHMEARQAMAGRLRAEPEEGEALLPREDSREPRQAAARTAVKVEPTRRAAGVQPGAAARVEALRGKVAAAERPEFSLEPAGSRATAVQPGAAARVEALRGKVAAGARAERNLGPADRRVQAARPVPAEEPPRGHA